MIQSFALDSAVIFTEIIKLNKIKLKTLICSSLLTQYKNFDVNQLIESVHLCSGFVYYLLTGFEIENKLWKPFSKLYLLKNRVL
jgi:hypothetical protein